MSDIERRQDPIALDRRTLLKRGLVAAGTIAAGGYAATELLSGGAALPERNARRAATAAVPVAHRSARAPNVLLIMVDQMRSDPIRCIDGPIAPGLTPNIEALGRESVRFINHYTASNDCTPARSTLLTGLYTHQTGCMITGGSTLHPGFPTWGTLMREHGYGAWWFGKWHLTHRDNHWSDSEGPAALERYGFSGGTFPSPDGAPGQGWRADPRIADQFEVWFAEHATAGPWCTTVSFVNPHDIAWWYLWSERTTSERTPPSLYHELPRNFETPAQLRAGGKPALQRSFQDVAAASFGPVPFEGPSVVPAWMPFLDLYAQLQHEVDGQVGRVLSTLAGMPEVAAETIVIFTSDHGEYSGAHGLRGKGGAVYEEGIRVPLLVKDPRGRLMRAPRKPRTQLTSSVDVAPLLLSIASGSRAWRSERRYRHLAQRLDLASILANPRARGREHVVHATDEIMTEFAIERYDASAPLHIVAVRTRQGKYATYVHWRDGDIEPVAAGAEAELYDYRTDGGRLELENVIERSALQEPMSATLARAFTEELREPLPRSLQRAQEEGFDDYFDTATRDATEATVQRRRIAERAGLARLSHGLRR